MYLNFLRRKIFLKNNLFLASFVFSFLDRLNFTSNIPFFCSFLFWFVLSKLFWNWTPTLNFRVKNNFIFFVWFIGLKWFRIGQLWIYFAFFFVHHRNFFLVVQMLLLFSDFEFRFDGLNGFRIEFVSKILVD